MKISFGKGNSGAQGDVVALEAVIGCALSDSLKKFVATNDGAVPETNIFKVNDANSSGVNGFIPVARIGAERANIENIKPAAYPVAWAEGGNYVLIDQEMSGAVFFWDHETAELSKLAPNFQAFLDLLEPFDINSIELKPEQVKKKWIDPEFLKRLKK